MNIGVNIDGITEIDKLVKNSEKAEEAGIDTLWFGEGPNHRHVFPLITTVAYKTKRVKIGTSIISVNLHRAFHVFQSFKLLGEEFGNRFIIGLGRGGEKHLRLVGKEKSKTLPLFEEYLSLYKNRFALKIPIYLGATGINTLRGIGKRFDGIIINSLSPKFIRWAKEKGDIKSRLLAIGPAFYNPGPEDEIDILMNCSLIASELPPSLSEELKISVEVQKVKKYFNSKNISALREMKDFLIGNFGLVGSKHEFKSRIKELEKIGISEIIFGYPISKNEVKFSQFLQQIPVLRGRS